MTDFSFLVCHNKCVSMLRRFHTKTNVLRKIFAGQVFIEHYLDGVPIETIARKLGLTPNAVSLRLKRMRDALAKNAPHMLRH